MGWTRGSVAFPLPQQPAVPPTEPVEGTWDAQEALVASRELSILSGIPAGSYLRQEPPETGSSRSTRLRIFGKRSGARGVLFWGVREPGSVSLGSGYSSIP